MRHFAISTDITAPPATVWAVMRDVERWHEWTASVRSIRLLDAKPLSVGVRALIRQPRLPPAMWKVVALDDGKSFTWVTWSPGLSVVARHGVEPTSAGTRATLSLEFNGLFGGFWGWLTGGMTSRYLAMEAAGLKRRSESGA